MPEQMQKSAPKSRVFRTVKGQVGPFPKSHVFDEAEFKRLHPLTKEAQDKGLVMATYHDQLISRLIGKGEIEEAPGETPMTTPVGPLNMNGSEPVATIPMD